MESGDPIASFRSLRRKQKAAATVALLKWGDLVMGESQRIVLLDEGTLAGSGDVSDPIERGERVEIELSYSTIYAQRRHEELNVKPSVAGRRPKFLEEPVNAAAPRLPAIIAAAVRGVTR